MNFTTTQSIPDTLRQKVKTILDPLFTENGSEAVLNPIQLLDFLAEHSVILQPKYYIRPDPCLPFHFIGSCTVGHIRFAVTDSSKETCKNIVAQKMLNFFLGDTEIDSVNKYPNHVRNYWDDTTNEINVAVRTLRIDDDNIQPENVEKFYEDDLSGILSFENKNSNYNRNPCVTSNDSKRSEGRRQINSIMIKAPEKRNSGWIVNKPNSKLESLCDRFSFSNNLCSSNSTGPISTSQSSSSTMRCEDDDMKVIDIDPQKQVSGDIPVTNSSLPKLSMSASQSSLSTVRDDSRVIVEPQCSLKDIPITNRDDPLSGIFNTDECRQLSNSINSVSQPSNVARKSSYEEPKQVITCDNLCVDFFDPFFKLRPRLNGNSASQKENALNMGKNDAYGQMSCEIQSKFALESGQNKTPFQILQEKAVKNYKLIPRSRIEKTDNGFSCTLILDVHTGYGEGRTKKEAKLKAATHLLQLLEDLP